MLALWTPGVNGNGAREGKKVARRRLCRVEAGGESGQVVVPRLVLREAGD